MSVSAALDVTGIGNAIVDVLARASEADLATHGIGKGTMTLIDSHRARVLGGVLRDPVMQSGGSAANTIAGLAALGAMTGFIGKVRDDEFGRAFSADLDRLGVAYSTPLATDGPPTAQCLIFVTPDGQRSMNTFLGASVELSEADIEPGIIAASAVTYLEGYLWDPPAAKAAIRSAISIAKTAGRQVAFTLSDPFCVGRWREEFRALLAGPVDILFANEHEALSLFQAERFDDVLQAVKATGKLAALTRSEKGAVIVQGAEVHVIDPEPAHVVDTTGAGDLFAAGFLFGLTRGRDLAVCGRMGATAAAEVISQMGPRPQRSLKTLFAQKGLI